MRPAIVVFLIALAGAGQQPLPDPTRDDAPVRLPNGKLQANEILKAEHASSLEDLAQISKLATELRAEMEKQDRFILSIASLRKAEELEKLAKRVRGRLKRN